MHSIHYFAVEADDSYQAYTIAREALLNEESIAPWSDWHVVGGGRWNSEGQQYEDSSSDVISFALDPDKFAETIDQIKTWRVEQMKWYVEHCDPNKLIQNANKFIENNAEAKPEEKFDMNNYYLKQITDMLSGFYNSDSHFYDYNNYSASLEYLEPNSRSFLVPVDFHH
jgi:hypothetical protein